MKNYFVLILMLVLMAMPALSAYVPFTISSGVNKQRVETIDVGGYGSPCTTSPCTIARQSGAWVTSVTRSAAGFYAVNFASGTFGSRPICIPQVDTVGGVGYEVGATSGSASLQNVETANNGTNVDAPFSMICMGTRP